MKVTERGESDESQINVGLRWFEHLNSGELDLSWRVRCGGGFIIETTVHICGSIPTLPWSDFISSPISCSFRKFDAMALMSFLP